MVGRASSALAGMLVRPWTTAEVLKPGQSRRPHHPCRLHLQVRGLRGAGLLGASCCACAQPACPLPTGATGASRVLAYLATLLCPAHPCS